MGQYTTYRAGAGTTGFRQKLVKHVFSLKVDIENQLTVKDCIEAKRQALESRRNTLAAARVIHLKDSAEFALQAEEVTCERCVLILYDRLSA